MKRFKTRWFEFVLTTTRISIQTVPQPSAVFDLHFEPHPDRGNICAAVSSTGTISFFRLDVPSNDSTATSSHQSSSELLQPLSVLRIPDLDEDTLFTYFTWHPTIPGLMAITTAAGQVSVVQIHADYSGLDIIEPAALEHSLEAWVVAFAPSSSSADAFTTLLSGGDDSALKHTTLCTSTDEEEVDTYTFPYPPVTNKKIHTAGVTAILPLSIPDHFGDDHLVLTGSYDDTLRLLRVKPLHKLSPGRPVIVLTEINLGGGVWRLSVIGVPIVDGEKWEVVVLVSCMHAGTRILRIRGVGDAEAGMEVLARFEEHRSMNYGSDWSRIDSQLRGNSKEVLCVSTSFYDRLLCVWTFQEGQPES